jgi:hypothetical protein
VLIESVDFSGGRAIRVAASEPIARIATAASLVAAQDTRDVPATHTGTIAIVAGAVIGRRSR